MSLGRGDGEAEIEDAEGAIGTKHDVPGLEIAMDDALRVDVGEHITQAANQVHGEWQVKRWAFLEHGVERLACQHFRDDIGTGAGVVVEFEDADDAGVMERCGDGFLTLELPEKRGIAFVAHERHFDGHFAAGGEVQGAEDGGHTALAKQTGDLEAPVQDLPDFDFVSHGPSLGAIWRWRPGPKRWPALWRARGAVRACRGRC